MNLPSRLKSPLPESVLVFVDRANPIGPLPASLESAHSNRKRDWFMGRTALLQALTFMGHDSIDFTSRQRSPQSYIALPGFTFSISHADGAAGCWLLHDPDGRYRIGLDLELRSRRISQAVTGRFRNPEDQITDELQLWCTKEAAYKTLPAEMQTSGRFSEIKIMSASDFQFQEIKGHHLNLDLGDYKGALAWVSSS